MHSVGVDLHRNRSHGECPRICVGVSELESHAYYCRQEEVL